MRWFDNEKIQTEKWAERKKVRRLIEKSSIETNRQTKRHYVYCICERFSYERRQIRSDRIFDDYLCTLHNQNFIILPTAIK